MSDRLLSLKEVANHLGIDYLDAWKLIREGKLPFMFKIGGSWKCRKEDLKEIKK